MAEIVSLHHICSELLMHFIGLEFSFYQSSTKRYQTSIYHRKYVLWYYYLELSKYVTVFIQNLMIILRNFN